MIKDPDPINNSKKTNPNFQEFIDQLESFLFTYLLLGFFVKTNRIDQNVL